MTARPTVDFTRLVAAEGIPTTEEALAVELATEVTASGSVITNDSRMSPFWRLQQALVIKPALWLLRNLLVGHVLPNSFAATAKGYYQDLKAWDVGLTRKPATRTRGTVELFKGAALDETLIPAETLISTERINGVTYTVKSVADVVISAGSDSGLVLCEALEPGTAYNLPAGYFNILPKAVPGISHASNPEDWITQPGDDEEDDDELGLRIQNQYSVVGRYHIDAVYRSMLASVAGIRSDHIFFEHDAPRGPGTANAYILMEVGATPQTLIDKLNHHVSTEGNHGHGDDLQCFALPYTDHALVLDIWPRAFISDADKAALQAEADSLVRAAFRETAAWPTVTRVQPFSRFSFSRLGQQLHSLLPDIDGVDFSDDLGETTAPVANIESGQSIPRLTSLTVIIHD
ncbi:baseplate J/gp47 family protein [Oceanisphaera arctica]|uniref:Baseplate protein J-like barrel domain-containing protein n=1 Tax=Oceanisphaera arctica TaxID=641510 RepID=A0A2P5TMX9_9GAMM|nr:baseplate J/gp47 family protein [Oceanisphaera arctica]PPL16815.1 hypothetical protein UN63_07795 [Oceanisphaera arctica]GHA05547.1 hypothetical protein GCM10007082_03130 [Oceanisphaera arctica]